MLTSLSGFVDWTLVDVDPLLFILSDGPQEHHRHLRVKFLQAAVGDGVRLHVPPGALHVETVDEGSLFRWHRDLLPDLLGDLTHQTHLVQRQLVLPGRALHDGRQEGLGVEEARQPDGGGEVEVRGPALPVLQ